MPERGDLTDHFYSPEEPAPDESPEQMEERRHRDNYRGTLRGQLMTLVVASVAASVALTSYCSVSAKNQLDADSVRLSRINGYIETIYSETDCGDAGRCWQLGGAKSFVGCRRHCPPMNPLRIESAAHSLILEGEQIDPEALAAPVIRHGDYDVGLAWTHLAYFAMLPGRHGKFDFGGADLRCSDFRSAKFQGINFRGADLAGAYIRPSIAPADSVNWLGARCPDGTLVDGGAEKSCWGHLSHNGKFPRCQLEDYLTRGFSWAERDPAFDADSWEGVDMTQARMR